MSEVPSIETSRTPSKIGAGLSGKSRQDLMRLKINRPAIVQVLCVEDVLPGMHEHDIFSEYDVHVVMKPEQRDAKVRQFLNIMATKTHEKGWYNIFRHILLNPPENTEESNRLQYKLLVCLLDATIIHSSKNQGTTFDTARRFTAFTPETAISRLSTAIPTALASHQSTLQIDQKQYSEEMIAKESILSVPEVCYIPSNHSTQSNQIKLDFKTSSSSSAGILCDGVNSELYISLLEEYGDISAAFIKEEKIALEAAKDLEIVVAAYYKCCTPNRFQLAESESVWNIVDNVEHHHLYVKYVRQLAAHHNKNIWEDLVMSFINVLYSSTHKKDTAEEIKHSTDRALLLVDFLLANSNYDEVDTLLNAVIQFLVPKNKYDTLIPLYHCYVQQMVLCNLNLDFQGAEKVSLSIQETLWEIEKISFGQKNVINMARFYLEQSHRLVELGRITSAYNWNIKSMQEASEKKPATLCLVLCNCIVCCCSLWNPCKAHDLSLEAVRLARHHFGIRHPLYLKALIQCCCYLSEFQCNQAAIDVAEMTVKTAKLIYTCNNINTAYAHLVLSKVLINTSHTYADEMYYSEAMDAFDMAKAVLPHAHPILHHFYVQLAHALHTKALHADADVSHKHKHLARAEFFAKEAQKLIKQVYGQISLPMGTVVGLLAKLYVGKEQFAEAEESLVLSEKIFSQCVTQESNHVKHAKAMLAAFYRTCGKVQNAYDLYMDLVNVSVKVSETQNIYYEWLHTCYEELILVMHYRHKHEEAEEMKLKLIRWLASSMQNKFKDITVDDLRHAPEAYQKFFMNINRWQKGFYKLMQQGEFVSRRKFSLPMI